MPESEVKFTKEDFDKSISDHLKIEHRLTVLETNYKIILLLLVGNFGIGVVNLVLHFR